MAPKPKSQKRVKASNGSIRPKVRTVTKQRGLQTVRTSSSMYHVRIEHEELIGSYCASATLPEQLFLFTLDPSDPQTFPWLSNLAKNFLYYRAIKLSFAWKSTAIVTTPGAVTIGIQYDPLAPTPEHPQDVAILGGSVSDHVYTSVTCTGLVSSLNTIPFHYLTTSGDARLQSMGRFALSLDTGTGTAALGKLWVRYAFEFWAPQFMQHDLQTMFSGTGDAIETASVGIFPYSGTGSIATVASAGDSSITAVNSSSGWVTVTVPNDGKYAITAQTPQVAGSSNGLLAIADPHNVVTSVETSDIHTATSLSGGSSYANIVSSAIVDVAKNATNVAGNVARSFCVTLANSVVRYAAAGVVGYLMVKRVPDRVTYRVEEASPEDRHMCVDWEGQRLWVPRTLVDSEVDSLLKFMTSERDRVVEGIASMRMAAAACSQAPPLKGSNTPGPSRR